MLHESARYNAHLLHAEGEKGTTFLLRFQILLVKYMSDILDISYK